MARTLTKQQPIRKLFNSALTDAIASKPLKGKDIVNSLWKEKPVNIIEFCDKYIGEPLYKGEQENFCIAMTGKDPYHFTDRYMEGHAFWGKGCIAGDTILKDEDTGKKYTIKEMVDKNISIKIKSLIIDENKSKGKYKITNCETGIPFKKGTEKLYEVKLKDGQKIKVTSEHKFLTQDGWKMLKELKPGDKILANNFHKEKERRQKISQTMKGIKKTVEHINNMKTAECSSRYEKGSVPHNVGISPSQKTKNKISNKLMGRKLSDQTRKNMSIANKGLKHHKSDCICMACKVMRNELKTYRKKFHHNGIIFRSSWEVKYAKYLESNNIAYEYEPEMFSLSNGRRYMPDFYLTSTNEYIEIKGHIDRNESGDKYLEKLNLFRKEYNVKLTMLMKKELQKLGVL